VAGLQGSRPKYPAMWSEIQKTIQKNRPPANGNWRESASSRAVRVSSFTDPVHRHSTAFSRTGADGFTTKIYSGVLLLLIENMCWFCKITDAGIPLRFQFETLCTPPFFLLYPSFSERTAGPPRSSIIFESLFLSFMEWILNVSFNFCKQFV